MNKSATKSLISLLPPHQYIKNLFLFLPLFFIGKILYFELYTSSLEVINRFHSEYLYLTTLFVILSIMRYLQIAYVDKNSGSPTKIIMKDVFMQITILSWVLSFAWIIYL